MFSASNKFLKPWAPFLDWIQVEISSYCNADCIYCPRTAYRKNWQNRQMPLEIFRKWIPAFQKTNLVYLQGWGEPFTHPDFFTMLEMAKKSGCMVGTTTNGSLPTTENIERLVRSGLDIIGFSLAGFGPENDAIRKGTRFKDIIQNIERIRRARQKFGVETPKIHIAYMLMRSMESALEHLPVFMARHGISETVVSSLALVTTPELKAEAMPVLDETAYQDLKQRLHKIRKAAQARGGCIHFHLVSPMRRVSGCSENTTHALVVGSDGTVAPCVMAHIPVSGENHHYVEDRREILKQLSFGNIDDDSLADVWHRKAYRDFRHALARRPVPAFCRSCLKRYIDSL